MNTVAILLHNIRSAHNVGSIFRTADAAGVSHIYLSGYTPTPVDRFGRPQKDIAKTALGAQTFIPWTYARTPGKVVEKLAGGGYQIIGVEQDERAQDYASFKVSGDALFILGNEVRGMSKGMKEKCDVLLEIPMRGKKESLNVSVAAGIVLFSCI